MSKMTKLQTSLRATTLILLVSMIHGQQALAINCGDQRPYCGHPLCPCPEALQSSSDHQAKILALGCIGEWPNQICVNGGRAQS